MTMCWMNVKNECNPNCEANVGGRSQSLPTNCRILYDFSVIAGTIDPYQKKETKKKPGVKKKPRIRGIV